MAKDTTGRLHVQVKTGGKRKLSSNLWLERQLNDPYVAKAKAAGYRSRPPPHRTSGPTWAFLVPTPDFLSASAWERGS